MLMLKYIYDILFASLGEKWF